jgi:hypothetical protein
MACSLLTLISKVTEVSLPYTLKLLPQGYQISDSNGVGYPLYLLVEAPIQLDDSDLKKSKIDELALATKAKIKIQHNIRFE